MLPTPSASSSNGSSNLRRILKSCKLELRELRLPGLEPLIRPNPKLSQISLPILRVPRYAAELFSAVGIGTGVRTNS